VEEVLTTLAVMMHLERHKDPKSMTLIFRKATGFINSRCTIKY
jgi:hypothetical protein